MHQTDSYGWSNNGSFNGIMGMFQKKKIQMTSHGVIMDPEQLAYVEFAGNVFTPRLT